MTRCVRPLDEVTNDDVAETLGSLGARRLDISRAEHESTGGSIAVDSAPGQGTTFSVTLPVYQPAKAAVSLKTT